MPAVLHVIVTFLLASFLVGWVSTDSEDELSCAQIFRHPVCECYPIPMSESLSCNFDHGRSMFISRKSLRFACNMQAPGVDYQFLSSDVNLSKTAITDVKFKLCSLPSNFTFLLDLFNQSRLIMLDLESNDSLETHLIESSFDGFDAEILRIRNFFHLVVSPNLLKSLVSLKELSIIETNVTLYPDSLGDARNLEVLKISTAHLRFLPERLLYEVTNIKSITFRYNYLEHIPETLFKNCRSLTSLNLGFNRLRTLPGKLFQNLSNLEVLNLEALHLENVPENLFNGLTSLKVLDMKNSANGTLEPPPGLFKGLSTLDVLNMSHMGLEKLPYSLFSDLSSLKELSLSFNKFVHISPETLAPLKNLESLYMNSNPLEEFPSDFSFSTKLAVLSIKRAKLKSIPKNFLRGTSKFSELFLSNNLIADLNDDAFRAIAHSVTEIDLSRNRISNIHWYRAFKDMSLLEKLNLDSNRIAGISNSINQLTSLKDLNLRNNKFDKFDARGMKFTGNGINIDLRNNSISHIPVRKLVELYSLLTPQGFPSNTFLLSNNPLECDCRAYYLRQFLNRKGTFGAEENRAVYESFNIKWEPPSCASPLSLKNTSLMSVDADLLLCPYEACPADCTCGLQITRSIVHIDCSVDVIRYPEEVFGAYRQESLPAPSELQFALKAEGRSISAIENIIGNFTGNLTSLDLSSKNIMEIDVAKLPRGLRTLRLDHNRISRITPEFVEYLNFLSQSQRVVTLSIANNPLVCDCKLLPFYKFVMLDSLSKKFKLTDVDQLTCLLGDHSTPRLLSELDQTDFCPGHMSTIVAASVVMALLSCLLLAMSLTYYRYGDIIRVWLYTRRLCLCCVSEEELDVDREYDAFISYAHQDEDFVVDHLVPQLEHGDPSFSLCLHYRDWLAGEWITDQIQRSVASSRRVVVVMSQNFVDSEWGRLEFIAAHKQALSDHTNRLIVILYGPMPDVSCMEHELQLYLTMNTYLRWGDPYFWERLRYAMPHRKTRATKKLEKVCSNSNVAHTIGGNKEGLIIENARNGASDNITEKIAYIS